MTRPKIRFQDHSYLIFEDPDALYKVQYRFLESGYVLNVLIGLTQSLTCFTIGYYNGSWATPSTSYSLPL